ncbi:PAB-dependent poly(A)-specific ribonuclease subunit 3 [Fasciola gigantica]|uniref:PAB-dependent poly(A)-specific ribonuclease subunit 3 n=1 Tax=Fasciola gigantica TaxID=46835 RepID=A0A504YNW3_FASGI|nr:PAB-dependent poly(A)-specific ribonuclease subunit 3 [Fasciola gigantica]
MASNFYYGGHPGANANMLTYPLKSLSIGSSQGSHHADLTASPNSPERNFAHPFSSAFNFSRPFGMSSEGGNMRLQTRPNGLPEFLNPRFTAPSATIRPSLLAGVTSNGFSATNHSANQGTIYKMSDRPQTRTSESDGSRNFGGFRGSIQGHSASRVLSSLQDSTHTSFNGNINSDACTAFLLNRFGGTGDTGYTVDGSNNSSDAQSSLSGTPNANPLDRLFSTSQSFNTMFSPSVRSVAQSPFQSHTVTNASLNQPPVEPASPLDRDMSGLGVEEKLTSLNPIRPAFAASQYYSNQQLENTRQLQSSGNLKAAAWILVPPVPEVTAAHMRTGRVHEIKSRACSERVFNPSYMDHELKQVLHNKIQACLFTADETVTEKLPRNLGAYTDLVPLELLQQPNVSVTFGLPCVCFKAWSPRFNRPMLLRRVVLPTTQEAALSPDAYYLAKQLADLDHPTIVGFRDIFFTNAFDDNSAVVVYEYIPCSSTVQQIHMSDPMKLTSFSSPFNVSRTVRPHSALKSVSSDLGMLPETTLWSYLVQLTHALRFIHQQVHRACGILDPTKVLIQDGTRLRVSCFGLKDVLFHGAQDPNVPEDQATDFVQLGKLILGVACGTAEAIQTSQRATSFNLLQRTYRPELVTLIRSLISGQITGVDQLTRATAPFAYDQLTRVLDHSDFLERQLFLAMECDRLFRLVVKLQSIVERTDRNPTSPDWSETGDRYMLKLFRDFLFHQTDQLGAPYLDLSHVISALNKVEAGSSERLCLVSRDSQNVIIVTYADVKHWLDTSFNHLVERHRHSRCELQLAQQRDARQQQRSHTVPGDSERITEPGDTDSIVDSGQPNEQ